MGGAKYLSMMLKRFEGDLKKALASYNAGPAAVERHKGIPCDHNSKRPEPQKGEGVHT